MKTYDSSSGDVLADRRADFAETLMLSGDAEGAADIMRQALERTPGWAFGWFRLGEMQEKAGAAAEAASAFATAMALDPADRLGATLKRHLVSGEAMPQTMPPAFVETLFDQYARNFEASLVGKLGYRGPDLLMEAIGAIHPGRFAHAIDLGCGTGLMGERLRPLVDRLDGCDISEGMLRKAKAKGIYDRLDKSDIGAAGSGAEGADAADLVVAADVFMYLGALETPFANAAAMLAPGGLFAFSVEDLAEPQGYRLRETRRYAHSLAYVQDRLADAGLAAMSVASGTIRRDRDAVVEALIVVARRP